MGLKGTMWWRGSALGVADGGTDGARQGRVEVAQVDPAGYQSPGHESDRAGFTRRQVLPPDVRLEGGHLGVAVVRATVALPLAALVNLDNRLMRADGQVRDPAHREFSCAGRLSLLQAHLSLLLVVKTRLFLRPRRKTKSALKNNIRFLRFCQ